MLLPGARVNKRGSAVLERSRPPSLWLGRFNGVDVGGYTQTATRPGADQVEDIHITWTGAGPLHGLWHHARTAAAVPRVSKY